MTRLPFWIWGGAALALAGCGVDVNVFGNPGGTGGTGGDAGSGNTPAGGNGGDGGVTTSSGGEAGSGGTPTCDSIPAETSLRPIDLIIVCEHSGSAFNLWPLIQAQLETFASAPRQPGTSLALIMNPDPSTFDACLPASYTPDFAYAEVPANGAAAATEMTSWGVASGGSPINPPLEGMLTEAVSHKMANPSHVGAAVYMMDSPASICQPNDVNEAVQMLSSALSVAEIRTHAIVLEGNSGTPDLTALAAAGGTGVPIDLSTPGDVATLATELEGIRERSIPCELPLPETPAGAEADYEQIALEVSLSGMPAETIQHVANKAACVGGEGWFWDDATSPTVLLLCDGTCDSLKKSLEYEAEVIFPCTR